MKKIWKRAAAALCVAGLLFGSLLSCSSGDDDDDNGGSVTPPPVEETDTAALYRFNATEDCGFVDGKITNFDGSAATEKGGAFLYYPHQLDLENDNVILEATVNFNNVSLGRVGVGAIGLDGISMNGYAVLTGIQKIRYGKSASLDPNMTENGQGFDSGATLTNDKVDAGKDYTFRITLKNGRFTFEILDNGTVVASKGSAYGTYFTASDKVFLAIGAQKGQTENATWSDIKVTVNGTSYNITEIKNSPDQSALSVETDKTEINVNGRKEISFKVLNKAGGQGSVTVESSDETIATAAVADGKVVITAIKAGSCTITVTNADNTALKKTIEVAVVDIVDSEAPADLAVYPAKDATDAYEDGEWMIGGFDADPKLLTGGRIKIYEVGADNALTEVDTIEFADEKQTVWENTALNVRDQLVRVENNAVYFTPHIGKIEASKKYLVAVPKESISGTVGGVAFEGLTNDVSKSSFIFTTRAAKTASATMTVDGAQNSSADFRTIQGALRAIGATDTGSYTINVAKGTYHELLYFNGKANVKISGETTDTKYGADVVVQYDNATCINSNEKTRNLLSFIGGDLILENITLNNTFSRAKYGKSDTQAEALGFDSPEGKFVAAYNCSFKSHQDTIRIIQKGWFYDCYIVGDVDFIWGETNSLACVIEKCKIESVYEDGAGSNVARILASKTGNGSQTIVTKGFVILNSEIICGSQSNTYLGRTPWTSGTINQCAVINTNVTSGSLNSDRWEGTACKVDGVDQKYIGWKEYNSGATAGTDSFAVIDDEMYSNEYSGRRAILNRVIDISDKSAPKFIYDDSNRYDIDALIAEQGWSVDEDTSKEVLEGEEAPDERTRVTWDFASIATNLSDGKMVSDTGYADNSETMISAKVTGDTRANGDNAQIKGTVKIPVVSVGDTVIVVPYGDAQYVHFKFGETGTEISSGEEQRYNATADDVATGYVDIIATDGNNYYKKIEARYTTLPNKPVEVAVEGANGDYSIASKAPVGAGQGTEIPDGTSDDGYFSWSGYKYHGTQYGCTTASTNKVSIILGGASVISITGSQHNSNGIMIAKIGDTVIATGSTKTSSDTGLLPFIADGNKGDIVEITFTGTNYLGTFNVRAKEAGDKASVTSVSVNDPGTVSLDGATLSATVITSMFASTEVKWSVVNAGTTGATIDAETGALTVTAAGTATVRATSVFDSTKYGEREVTVVSYSIDPFSSAFVSNVSGSLEGLTTTSSEGTTVFYCSDKPTVVTVDENTGALTKVASGVATITAGIKVDGATIPGITTSYVVDVLADGTSSYTWSMADMHTSGKAQGLTDADGQLTINRDINLNGVIVDVDQNGVTIRNTKSNVDMLITLADLWIPVNSELKGKTTIKLNGYKDNKYVAKFKIKNTELPCDASYVYSIECNSYDLTEKDGKNYLVVTSCGTGNNKYLNSIVIEVTN